MRGGQLARQWQLIQRLAKSRAGVSLDDLAAGAIACALLHGARLALGGWW